MATDPQNPYVRFADPDDDEREENPYARFAGPARDTTAASDATSVAVGREGSRGVPDFIRQGARGLAEAGYGTGTGVLRLADLIPGVDTDRAVEAVGESREEMQRFYGDPETGAGVAGRMTGRVLGEGALMAAGGLGTRTAAGAAGRAAGRAGATRAGRALEALARPANSRLGRLGQDVAYGAPFDVTIAAAGPEDASAPALAELLEHETLEGFRQTPAGRVVADVTRKAAESPAGRMAFEVGLGAAGAGLIHGVGAGASAGGRAVGRAIDPVGDRVSEGIRDFARQGAGEAPATGLAQEFMEVVGPGAKIRHPSGVVVTVESVQDGVARGKNIQGFDYEVPLSRAEVIEPASVPIREYDPQRMVRPGEEQPTRTEGPSPGRGQAATSEAEPEPVPPPRLRPREREAPPPATTMNPEEVLEREAERFGATGQGGTSDQVDIARRVIRREQEAATRELEDLPDDELLRRYLNRTRTATIEYPRAGAGSRNALGRLNQAQDALKQMEAEFEARGLDAPDPEMAFVDVTPDDFPNTVGGLVESVQARIDTGLDDDALEAALREAETAAARSTDMEPHIRRALLAGEWAKRQGDPVRAGIIHRQLLESLAGAGAGGAAGAAIDENPYRGFALGAAAGGLAPRIARAEAADFAERGALRSGSLGEQPPSRPRLRATHNTTPEGVRFAEEMGGIPNPSMAIHRADQPFSSMGEVSLVGRRDLVDPADPDVDVFDADIWSGRTPDRLYETTPETEALLRELQSETRRVEGHSGISRAEQYMEQGRDPAETASALWTSPAAHGIYLRERGVEIPTFTGEPGTRQGIPRSEIEALTEQNGGREAFEDWWQQRISETYGDAYFQREGRSRKIPYTLENVSEEMARRSDPRGAEAAPFMTPSRARGSAARKVESLEDLEAYREQLVTREQVQEASKAQDDMRSGVTDALIVHHPRYEGKQGVIPTWETLDDMHQAIIHLGKSGRRSDTAARAALERVGFKDVSEKAVEQFSEYAEAVLDAPTQYLEAKFRRPVRLEEFSAAIVPDDTPADVVEGLMARGVEVETYPRRDAEARTEAFSRLRGGDRETIEAEGMLFARGGPTLAGAAIGATVDEEDRSRGALIGGALGAGVEIASAARTIRRATTEAGETLTREVGRALNDPAVKRVAESFGKGSSDSFMGRLRSRSIPEHAAALAHYLRYKGFRQPLPMERFGEVVGKSPELRNQLAQARGWLPAAHLHIENGLHPLRETLSETENLEDAVKAYLRSKRGLQLMEAGKETTKEQAADWRRTIERFDDIEPVREGAEAISAYYRDLLRMKRDAGVITADQYEAAIAEGDFYTPFLPDDIADAVRTGAGGGQYAPNRSAGVRKMTERLNEADIVDPFEQGILDTYETFQRVARQRVANVIGGIVEADPDGAAAFLRQLEPERGPEGGITPPKAKDGALVEAIVDGERRWYEVTDEDLYASWASFDQRLQSQLLDAMNATRRVMQGGVTSHPSFLVANGVRDFFVSGLQYGDRSLRRSAIEAGVGAGAGAAVSEDDKLRGAALGAGLVSGGFMAKHWGEHIARTVAATADIMGAEATGATYGAVIGGLVGQERDDGGFTGWLQGTMAGALAGAVVGRGARLAGRGGDRAAYEEFIREGGGNFGFYAKDRKDARRMMQLLERQGVEASDFINPRSWWEALQYVGKAIETAPRLAMYKNLRAAGEDVGEAIFSARDLSLDFAVKPGSKGLQAAAQTVPFFNPALQGMDKAARLLADPKTTAIATGTILAPTMALWSINKEDDAYWNRPLYERNTYWLVPKRLTGGPEGEFWRVPKPFELGFIYASLPERMLDYAYQQDPEQLRFSLIDAYGTYGPGNLAPVPVAGGPVLEATRGEHGYDAFRRRPINPYPWKNVEASEQYTDRTSSLALGLSRAVQAAGGPSISPAKIDHVLVGHTGSLGAQILDWTSAGARRLGLDDRPAPAGAGQGMFARFSSSPEHITEPERAFRRRFERSERAYNTLREMVDAGDTERARRYARENADAIARYDELKEVQDMIGEVWDVRRAVYDSEQLEPEEKRRLLGAINQRLGGALMAMSRGQGLELPEIPGGKEPALAAPTR